MFIDELTKLAKRNLEGNIQIKFLSLDKKSYEYTKQIIDKETELINKKDEYKYKSGNDKYLEYDNEIFKVNNIELNTKILNDYRLEFKLIKPSLIKVNSNNKLTLISNNTIYLYYLYSIINIEFIEINRPNGKIFYEINCKINNIADGFDNKINALNNALIFLLKCIQQTENIYTYDERNKIIEFYNKNMNISRSVSDQPYPTQNIKVHARNLKKEDLVIGGIVGGDISYALSIKADGERYDLLIKDNNIWLILADNNICNKICSFNKPINKVLDGIIFDGEEVPKEKRNDKSFKYYYIAFTHLKEKKMIIDKSLKDRIKNRDKLIELLNNEIINNSLTNILYIGKMEYIFLNSNNIFEETRKLKEKKQDYLTDGFMITPDSSYNPFYKKENDIYIIDEEYKNLSLNERTLKNYPDLCKVKPLNELTIDFIIDYPSPSNNNKTRLLVNFENELVEFTGTKKHPFSINENVDWDDEIIVNNKYKNTVIELGPGSNYKKPLNKVILYGVRERPYKKYPNKIDFANDIWDKLYEESIVDVLSGETNELAKIYLNKLKIDLLNSIDNNKSFLITKRDKKFFIKNELIDKFNIEYIENYDFNKMSFEEINKLILKYNILLFDNDMWLYFSILEKGTFVYFFDSENYNINDLFYNVTQVDYQNTNVLLSDEERIICSNYYYGISLAKEDYFMKNSLINNDILTKKLKQQDKIDKIVKKNKETIYSKEEEQINELSKEIEKESDNFRNSINLRELRELKLIKMENDNKIFIEEDRKINSPILSSEKITKELKEPKYYSSLTDKDYKTIIKNTEESLENINEKKLKKNIYNIKMTDVSYLDDPNFHPFSKKYPGLEDLFDDAELWLARAGLNYLEYFKNYKLPNMKTVTDDEIINILNDIKIDIFIIMIYKEYDPEMLDDTKTPNYTNAYKLDIKKLPAFFNFLYQVYVTKAKITRFWFSKTKLNDIKDDMIYMKKQLYTTHKDFEFEDFKGIKGDKLELKQIEVETKINKAKIPTFKENLIKKEEKKITTPQRNRSDSTDSTNSTNSIIGEKIKKPEPIVRTFREKMAQSKEEEDELEKIEIDGIDEYIEESGDFFTVNTVKDINTFFHSVLKCFNYEKYNDSIERQKQELARDLRIEVIDKIQDINYMKGKLNDNIGIVTAVKELEAKREIPPNLAPYLARAMQCNIIIYSSKQFIEVNPVKKYPTFIFNYFKGAYKPIGLLKPGEQNITLNYPA